MSGETLGISPDTKNPAADSLWGVDWANRFNLFLNRFDSGLPPQTSTLLCVTSLPPTTQPIHMTPPAPPPPSPTRPPPCWTRWHQLQCQQDTESGESPGPVEDLPGASTRVCTPEGAEWLQIGGTGITANEDPGKAYPGPPQTSGELSHGPLYSLLTSRALGWMTQSHDTQICVPPGKTGMHCEHHEALFSFSSAFNTIQWSLLRIKREGVGVDQRLVTWTINYLTSRAQNLRSLDCVSNMVLDSTGDPQGTVLAPYLFTLYTDSYHIQKLSDITAIVPGGDKCEYRGLLNDFAEWHQWNGLQLNANKTRELVGDFHRISPVSIQGTEIEVVQS